MARRLNYFLLCEVKPEGWSRRLVVPVPLFVVDELLDCWPLMQRVLKKFLPEDTGYFGGILQENGLAWDWGTLSLRDVKQFWRKIRKLGSFTLVDVESQEVKVKIRLI